MRKKEGETGAYMTVEISLLFPIILTLILCIIYFIFYSYNSTVAFQNSAICALYGKYLVYENQDKDEKVHHMYRILELLNEEQYIMSEEWKQKVTMEGNYIKVNQEGNVKIPLLVPQIMSKLNFKEGVETKKQNAVFYVRQVRKVKVNET